MGMGWSVAVTRPCQEARACQHLARQGFIHYLPKTLSRSLREIPLFPRYVFVELREQWYSLLGTFGVSYMLLANERPAVVDDAIIKRIRAMEKNGLVALPEAQDFRFKINQSVRINSGHFAGFMGLYQGQTAREREKVLLSCLGCVELPMGMIEAVAA